MEKAIRSVTVDLDKAPSERWVHVIKECHEDIREFGKNMNSILSQQFSPLFSKMWKKLHFVARVARFPKEYAEEIDGIALAVKDCNLTKDDIILLNVALDYMSRCTSAIVSCKEGLHHFRTLDWDLPELNKLLIKVFFVRGGKILYEGYTFVGMVGLLTGMRPGAFAISFNFRKSRKRNWSLPSFSNYAGILFRQTLEKRRHFADACVQLHCTKMNGSGYIILSGTHHGEGLVIIKGPDARIVTLQGLCLVQTNHDPGITRVDPSWAGDDEILLSTIDRQLQILNYIDSLPCLPSVAEMCKLMKKAPIHNQSTLFLTAMSAFTGISIESSDHRIPRSSLKVHSRLSLGGASGKHVT